jgi:hypothetical protein
VEPVARGARLGHFDGLSGRLVEVFLRQRPRDVGGPFPCLSGEIDGILSVAAMGPEVFDEREHVLMCNGSL